MPHVLSVRTMTLLALAAAPATALAQPPNLVAFDIVYSAEMYDGTVQGETFHHLVKPAPTEPASWTSPVDYAHGTVYIHQEVMTKPSMRNTIITICFDGDLAGYGCIDTKTYTTTGVHETVAPITSTWQYGKIAWGKRRTEYHLVIKDPALGGAQGGKPASDYVPSKMRIVMTIVPPGGKYVEPPPLGEGGPDGGAAPADAGAPGADAASTTADAGAAPDAATTDPTPSPDAATTKPTKADAATTPPKADPQPEDPGTGGSGGGTRPASKSGGCTLGGGSPTAGSLLLLALALGFRRRRR
ncbi:MAG TPA: MYXO-CTERM sorting domain-containing protein [Polyangia bacterium]|nr:MYXO-CTERM sorting domain-containing protein [Polyangia bacterium]